MPITAPDLKTTSSFSTLRGQLQRLKKCYGLCALKSGTEVEDMSFEEIAFLRHLSLGIVPLYVKISGPEARNDIRELSRLHVDGLIAPMIESAYALQKFIESLRDLLEAAAYHKLVKGINIETVTALQNLEDILNAPAAREIDQITAARSDLSASMAEAEAGSESGNLAASDGRVIANCAHITAQAQERGIAVSVGGQLEPAIATHLIATVGSNFLNSRHMVLDVMQFKFRHSNKTAANKEEVSTFISEAITENLHFECLLYQLMAEHFALKSEYYEKRIAVIEERIKGGNKSQLKSKVGLPLRMKK